VQPTTTSSSMPTSINGSPAVRTRRRQPQAPLVPSWEAFRISF
jgi:hypothetical protein